MHTSDPKDLISGLLEKETQHTQLSHVGPLQHLKFAYQYLRKDVESRPNGYKIGIFTVMISAAFLVLLGSLSELIPLIMINLAEVQISENDFAIQSAGISGGDPLFMSLLNYTEINSKLTGIEEIEGCAGRWYFQVKASNPGNIQTETTKLRSVAIMLNSTHEQLIGLGRKLQLPTLNEGEIWLTQSLADMLGIFGGMVVIKT